MLLWQLFRTFFRIGAFTFGGGYAMIPLIEREVTEKQHWVERPAFLDLLALAQSSPGPISLNTAVFVGYKMRGFAGAMAAMLGIVLPSFLIILLIATYFPKVQQNPWVTAAFRAMRPAVVALMLWPVLSLSRQIHPALLLVVAAVALSVWGLHLSPILLILTGAAVGALHTWRLLRSREDKK